MKKLIIELNNITDIYCQFNHNLLNENLDQYIENQFKFLPIKKTCIVIKGINDVSKQQQIQKLFNNFYFIKVNQMKKIDRFDDWKRLVLFLLGILMILLSSQFSFLLSEILLIAGWVALWETVYDILFLGIKRNRLYHLCKMLSTCKIIFE